MKHYCKKAMALMLAIALVLLCIPSTVHAETATTSDKVDREVVLVLDYSGSMSGTPLKMMQSAAKIFSKQLFEAQGKSKIAIVAYDHSILGTLGFTDDLSKVTTFIDNQKTPWGGTNIYQALQKADEILKNGNEKAVKNLVLLTDGLPQSGQKVSTGKYQSYSIYNAAYGNAIYNYYAENIEQNYNVYTLGFFHSLSKSSKPFATELLTDIQNKGYFEVTDPDKLVFTFGDVASEIVNPVNQDNCPIIIVPGVMGSQLYDSSLDLVWADTGRIANPFYRLSTHMAIGKSLQVKNFDSTTGEPYNQSLKRAGSREYGTQKTYQNLVDGLCETYVDGNGNPTKNVYFFSYDFRYSNTYSAQVLNDYITRVLQSNPGYTKVDIVAHSMGGLVVSDYVRVNGNEKFRKIITCGTPYEGAPKLVNSVLTNKVMDNFFTDFALRFLGGLDKECKASFPALAELAPTDRYFSTHSNSFVEYQGLKWVGFLKLKRIYKTLNYAEYNNKNRIIFGSTNANNASAFHSALRCAEGYNLLASLDNTYFIVGINQKTISGITYNDGGSLKKIKVKDVSYEVTGDGTVPYDSSTMVKALEKLPTSRFMKVKTDHTGSAGCGNVGYPSVAFANIVHILSSAETELPTSVTTDELEKRGYIVIRIACPVDVTVNHNGEILTSNLEAPVTYAEYGVLDIFGEDAEIKTLCLDVDNYDVVLNGTDDGTMDFAVRYFNEENQLEEEVEFFDVKITPSTIITTTINRESILLNVDEDGDGLVDFTLTPGSCEGNGHVTVTSETSRTFANDKYEVKYEVVNVSGDDYIVNMAITNTTNETLHNWKFALDTTDTINSIWNGTAAKEEDCTVFANAGYNQDIAPNETVLVGFMATKSGDITYPEHFRFLKEEAVAAAPAPSYNVTFEKTSEWGIGYNASIKITNTSDQPLNDWTLFFDFDEDITNIWTGTILSHENGHYVIQNAGYNHNILPGESTSIDFIVGTATGDTEPSNFVISTIN